MEAIYKSLKHWFEYCYEHFEEINRKMFSMLFLVMSFVFLIGTFKNIVLLVFAIGCYLMHLAWLRD